jgi:hypothetical protein
MKEMRSSRDDVALLNIRHGADGTEVVPFEYDLESLFHDDLSSALTAPTEDGVFEGLLLRGLLDG